VLNQLELCVHFLRLTQVFDASGAGHGPRRVEIGNFWGKWRVRHG
jgi:hypothetical protein